MQARAPRRAGRPGRAGKLRQPMAEWLRPWHCPNLRDAACPRRELATVTAPDSRVTASEDYLRLRVERAAAAAHPTPSPSPLSLSYSWLRCSSKSRCGWRITLPPWMCTWAVRDRMIGLLSVRLGQCPHVVLENVLVPGPKFCFREGSAIQQSEGECLLWGEGGKRVV
jgi:hypothetical protein